MDYKGEWEATHVSQKFSDVSMVLLPREDNPERLGGHMSFPGAPVLTKPIHVTFIDERIHIVFETPAPDGLNVRFEGQAIDDQTLEGTLIFGGTEYPSVDVTFVKRG